MGVCVLIYNLYIVELKAINNIPKDTDIEQHTNLGIDDKADRTEASNSKRGKFIYYINESPRKTSKELIISVFMQGN